MNKLGKLPFVPKASDFKAVDFLETVTLTTPPANFGHGRIFADGEDFLKDWDMNGNGPDPSVAAGFGGAGDCVFACGAHTTRAAAKTAGHTVKITGKESIADYSVVTGYVLGDESTDNGTDMRQAMSYRRKTGLLDAAGNRHKIGAYLSVTPNDWKELMQIAWSFDAVEIGFQFQAAQYDQFDGGVWDYVPGSPIEGGHAIPVFGRNRGRGGVVSWAKHLWITQAFYENLNDETWAVVYLDSLNSHGVNDRGLNVTQLNQALAGLH